jgi:hypothetical protein
LKCPHDHIDLGLAHDVERFTSIGRFGNHGEVGLVGEELAQPGPDHGVVVDDCNANHGWCGVLHR